MGEIYHPDTIDKQHLINTWEIGMRKDNPQKKTCSTCYQEYTPKV